MLLLRHGKSAWDTDAVTDFERPLAKRGHRNVTRMGIWLKQHNLVPDLVLSSPARRAADTASLVTTELGCNPPILEEALYLADCTVLLTILAGCSRTPACLMLVGHNPGLEDLLVYLCEAVPLPSDNKRLPTATVAHMQMPAHWAHLQAGSACLLSLTRPRSLPSIS